MRRSGYKSIFHIYIIFFIMIIGTLAAGFGMILYNITIQKPDGQIGISSWPINFTKSFSKYITVTENKPLVKQSGLKLLEDNRLWFQIIDEYGDEIQSFQKPQGITTHYSPSNFIRIYQGDIKDFTVFTGELKAGNKEWTYLIGFPARISKVTMYFNKDRFHTLRPIAAVMLYAMLLLFIISCFIYGLFLAKKLMQIRKSIREISARNYMPGKISGSFSEIYEELNILNAEIKSSDEARRKDDRLREEWIANITHDLKTPLSPIRGYAELLSDPASITEPDKINRYGDIILKNTAFAEELLNDLKLTYQLKNDMLLLHLGKQNMVRFIKELIIDLLNNPEYEARYISFHSLSENIELAIDTVLLKRAFNNLLTNALIHNSKDTEIRVCMKTEDRVRIEIQDNGRGLTKEELDRLFIRYYRGNSAKDKPEGSGLGMAIAKQIIELHGGSIQAESKPGYGCCMIIEFPTN